MSAFRMGTERRVYDRPYCVVAPVAIGVEAEDENEEDGDGVSSLASVTGEGPGFAASVGLAEPIGAVPL